MQERGVDINATLEAWADIVIKIWREKIIDLKVIDTHSLFESLLDEMLRNAGEDISRIDFSFRLYGVYVDMGVGKEIEKGNAGDLGFTPTRQPKEWYSKKFYGQIMKLREILVEKYSKAVVYTMLNTFNEAFDQRSGDIMHSKTVGSLRTVRYREVQARRNARNYTARRAKDGHWSGGKYWKPN